MKAAENMPGRFGAGDGLSSYWLTHQAAELQKSHRRNVLIDIYRENVRGPRSVASRSRPSHFYIVAIAKSPPTMIRMRRQAAPKYYRHQLLTESILKISHAAMRRHARNEMLKRK